MPPRSSSPAPSNGILIFLVSALFMITLAFIGVFYVESNTNFQKVTDNQQTNSQKSQIQRDDLTKITCSMWNTMTTSPNVHPSPSMATQMNKLCR